MNTDTPHRRGLSRILAAIRGSLGASLIATPFKRGSKGTTNPRANYRPRFLYRPPAAIAETWNGAQWDLLPEELWLLIFSFLPLEELLNCSSVCWRWNALTQDESLWKSLAGTRAGVRSLTPFVSWKRRTFEWNKHAHFVSCFACNGYPIDGALLECLHCEDVYICQRCDKERPPHDPTHILLKVYVRVENEARINWAMNLSSTPNSTLTCSQCLRTSLLPDHSASDFRNTLYSDFDASDEEDHATPPRACYLQCAVCEGYRLCSECAKSSLPLPHFQTPPFHRYRRVHRYGAAPIDTRLEKQCVVCLSRTSATPRYRCMDCTDFGKYLCANCYEQGKANEVCKTSTASTNGEPHRWYRFDTAAGHNAYCDGCRDSNIAGIRYRCAVCVDFDYCEVCEAKLAEGIVSRVSNQNNRDRHDLTHPMMKLLHQGMRDSVRYVGFR